MIEKIKIELNELSEFPELIPKEGTKLDVSNSDFALGLCPACASDWDGGEYKDLYMKWKKFNIDGFGDKSDDEIEIEAHNFSLISSPRISHLRGGGRHGMMFHQCPFCRTAWNTITGEQIDNWVYNIQ